jgi:hypothetical protein
VPICGVPLSNKCINTGVPIGPLYEKEKKTFVITKNTFVLPSKLPNSNLKITKINKYKPAILSSSNHIQLSIISDFGKDKQIIH